MFCSNSQVVSGSNRRSAIREGDITALTRRQATRILAVAHLLGNYECDTVASFMGHQNSHVKKYAAHKLLSGLGTALAVLSVSTTTEPDFASFNTKAWTADQARAVLTIMAERSMTAGEIAARIGCTTRRVTDWGKKLAKG